MENYKIKLHYRFFGIIKLILKERLIRLQSLKAFLVLYQLSRGLLI
jgi:hypothetical protein